jgi:dolichyl-diphosphooligosaccharide---protein glycosyltransferase
MSTDALDSHSVTAAMVFSKLLNIYLDPTIPEAEEEEPASGATTPLSKKTKKAAATADKKSKQSLLPEELKDLLSSNPGIYSWQSRLLVLVPLVASLVMFVHHSTFVTQSAYSSPSVVLASRNADGSQHIIDDFREAYYWLRQNTKEDAVVMSWWDYGYQIAGMADRPTLVDNNTWNNSACTQTVLMNASLTQCDLQPISLPLAKQCRAMKPSPILSCVSTT